jgi:hypothetical protein
MVRTLTIIGTVKKMDFISDLEYGRSKLMIVFNDSYKSEGFEVGIEEANKILIDLGLHLEYKFIEDYVSDNGEYAYTLTVEKRKQKNNE